MSATNALETALLNLYFNATAIANVADNAASAPLTSLFVSLYTADPGETGTQATNEVVYTGYARVAVLRNGTGWTVSGNQAASAADIEFPECTGGTATATHFGIGRGASGATVLDFKGALTASRIINPGITPRFAAGQLTVTAD
jgi:hypothetical protein